MDISLCCHPTTMRGMAPNEMGVCFSRRGGVVCHKFLGGHRQRTEGGSSLLFLQSFFEDRMKNASACTTAGSPERQEAGNVSPNLQA
mmetsp:Transcript_11171/g.21617  ORF Transcript_11171/g.21617 Transcript_11171/m.21617 type:complete len:87 (-) Transcript_11171:24-284(-)